MSDDRMEPSARDRIVRAAYASFTEVGFTRTTYQRIADAVGRDRALVQYHVQKKERLAVDFLVGLLTRAEGHVVDQRLVPDREPVPYRYVLAQIYFATLTQPRLRGFTTDVLTSRRIVEELVDFDVEWNVAFLDPAPEERQAVADDSVMAVGGAYELLYRRLRRGADDVDVVDLARRTVLGALPHLVRSDPAVLDQLAGHTLPGDHLALTATELLDATLGTG